MPPREILNGFDATGMAEMPGAQGIQGMHQVGGATIKGSPGVIEVDLGDDGLYSQERADTDGGEFHENLADYLYTSQRKLIAQDFLEYRRIDEQSRAEWNQRLDTALVMLGITREDKKNLPFKGASAIVHPGIAKAVVQYQSRAIEEFFPATGPVKVTTVGQATREKRDQAQRVEDFMNWYYTDGDKGYFPDTDQLHFKLPLMGSVFRKSYMGPTTGRPTQRHVGAQDFIAPYHGQDLETMSRYAHRYWMSGNEIKRSIAKGFFSDIQLPRGNTHVQLLSSEDDKRVEDRGDLRTPVLHEDDDLYEILEYHADYTLPAGIDEELEPGFALPYILFIEATTQEVLRVERNWREADIDYLKRVWFTHYRYLPGLGFYGFGLLHVIGSLGEAATGAVRAILDSAARNNMQGGFKAKEVKGGEMTLENGVWKDIDLSAEELSKAFYTPPTHPPSEALFRLVEILTSEMDKFASTTEAVVGDAPTNGPVGSTLAMIEQGSKVFSAIHKRTHASARHEFALFGELVQFSEVDQYPYSFKGQDQVIYKADFDDRVDVLPVSDPNIWSSTQRIALAQTVFQVVTTSPQIYGLEQQREAHRRLLEALKTPDIDVLLPEKQIEPYLDPVSENMRMMIGKPARSYPHQLHAAHIQVHENWLQQQVATQPKEVLDRLLPQALAHIQEHKAYAYQQQVMQQMGVELPIFDLGAGEEEQSPMPPELEAMLSRATAQHLLPPPANPKQDEETQAAMSEEQRKDMAAQRDQDRKDQATEREQQRLDLKTMLDQRRQDHDFVTQQHRDNRAFASQQLRDEDTTDADLAVTARRAAIDEAARKSKAAVAAKKNGASKR